MLRLNKIYIPIVSIMLLTGLLAEANENKENNIWQNLKDLKWEDGRLRIEGQGWNGLQSGRRSRTGDRGVVVSIEKDFALNNKLSVGLRAIPFFYMDQEDRKNHEGGDIFGIGIGVTTRYYLHEVHDGWFGEICESLIGQSEKFHGNSGSLNFAIEIGIGYEFDNNWHISAKWRHMSNGGIADHNAGVNAVGIGIGISF